MHIATTLLVIAGALLLTGAGVLSLVNDLLGRGPHDAPLIEEDGLRWPPRYQGAPSAQETSAESRVDGMAVHATRR